MEFNDPRLPDRFWSKVSFDPDGCWNWTASVSNFTGYGWYRLDGKAINPHRLICRVAHGEPPEKHMALHSCDNRKCVNPEHLRWGTARENLQDAVDRGRLDLGAWGRAKTHCPRDHPYDEENTYISKSGSRACRECYREHWRQWNKRRKQPGYKPRNER